MLFGNERSETNSTPENLQQSNGTVICFVFGSTARLAALDICCDASLARGTLVALETDFPKFADTTCSS